MALSNNITSFVNFIAILCSIPIIVTGVWLSSKQGYECVSLARWPLTILGLLLLLVSLAGFVGAFWNRQSLLALYLFSMALLIVLLLALLVFAFAVTRPDGGFDVPGRGFREYRLGGFSAWLRNYVEKGGHWEGIVSCLSRSSVCRRLSAGYVTPDQFFVAHLSPIQSGCCKPPTACGYNYVNPTMWINPANPGADPDCYVWNNDQSALCYGCQSCKAGLLGNLRKEWRKVNVILIVSVVVLIWVYIIACSAFKNAQTEDLFRRYKHEFV
ncbi:Tetraspanin-2 [Acorus gramineus]|nr:Tetraspanin-2 [Acorus gramineus]